MTQPWQLFRAAGSTKQFMADVRQAVTDMDYWRYISDNGADAFTHDGNGGGWVSDPTAARAIYLADNDGRVRANARRHVARCEIVIGAGLELIAHVREGLGEIYADALDAHYIDGMSLRIIAEDSGVSKSAIQQRIDVACDWADSQPLKRLFDLRY